MLETRKADRGFALRRTRECANGHRVATIEILSTVYSGLPPQRRRRSLTTIEARVIRAKRDAEIVRACKTRTRIDVATEYGLSSDRVSQIVRASCSASRAAATSTARKGLSNVA